MFSDSHVVEVMPLRFWVPMLIIVILGERDTTSVWGVLGKDFNRPDPEIRPSIQIDYLGRGLN